MKLELIKTENYLIVVDDNEIKEGEWYYDDRRQVRKAVMGDGLYWAVRNGYKRVLAHLPLNDSADLKRVMLLPPFSRHQEDGVEELAFRNTNRLKDFLSEKEFNCMKQGFENGYNKAKESERNNLTPFKNLIVLIENGLLKGTVETNLIIDQEISMCKEYLNKLSQPNTPAPTRFEFEMEKDYQYNDDGEPIGFKVHNSNKIKTITNAQGQQVACGKYIYE